MARHRSNIEIMGKMLSMGENGTGTTELMYGVNMSYRQTQNYLGFLITHEFIDKLVAGNPTTAFS